VVVAVLSTRMSVIIDRFGSARIAVAAFISLVAGYAVFLRVGVRPDYPTVIFPAVVLIGIAFGLGFSALSLAATDGVAGREQGLAASLFQTSFQVGGAIVLAVVTAVIDAGGASRITSSTSVQATLGAYRPALALITVVSAIGAITALSGLRPGRRAALAPAAAAKSVPVRADDLAAEIAREAELAGETRQVPVARESGDVRESGEASDVSWPHEPAPSRDCGDPISA
jgi:hypothetical protein